MWLFALLWSGCSGVVIGLLGGGGSVLMVPILIYAVGMEARQAIASSLFLVAVTSFLTAIPRICRGEVIWRLGLTFAGFASVGSYLGGRLAAFVEVKLLLTGFGGMMLVTAWAMLRPRRKGEEIEEGQEGEGLEVAKGRAKGRLGKVGVQAFGVGTITGLVGAGGGFLIVPVLLLLSKVPMKAAVSTSMVVISINSLLGGFGHWASVSIPWAKVGALTTAAIGGGVVGTLLSQRVSQTSIRRLFGVLLLGMGLFLLGEQVALWQR